MKGLMLDKLKGNFILNINELFESIEYKNLDYNWLITNYDGTQEFADTFYKDNDFIWISGEKFYEFLNKNTVQFIWGVVSGFDKNIKLNEVLKYSLPYANGNEEIWNTNIYTQNPLAKIEIIAWDSALVIVISEDDKIIETIKKAYPNAKDLLEYNLSIK